METAPETVDSSPGPEALAVTEQRRKLVKTVLGEMPVKDRELLRRVCLDEEDKDTVCRDYGVDRSYLRVLLHRARNRFRVALAQADSSASRQSEAAIRSRSAKTTESLEGPLRPGAKPEHPTSGSASLDYSIHELKANFYSFGNRLDNQNSSVQ
jgi:hypothetical protein